MKINMQSIDVNQATVLLVCNILGFTLTVGPETEWGAVYNVETPEGIFTWYSGFR